MKTLNLDALAKTNRTLTIGGINYEVVEMTVENFIETTKAAQKLGDSAGIVEQMEAAIDMILRSIPGMEKSVLSNLNLEQLMTIVKFVRGEMDGIEETPAAEGADEGK